MKSGRRLVGSKVHTPPSFRVVSPGPQINALCFHLHRRSSLSFSSSHPLLSLHIFLAPPLSSPKLPITQQAQVARRLDVDEHTHSLRLFQCVRWSYIPFFVQPLKILSSLIPAPSLFSSSFFPTHLSTPSRNRRFFTKCTCLRFLPRLSSTLGESHDKSPLKISGEMALHDGLGH